jgi:excisionase family DNA binding protein
MSKPDVLIKPRKAGAMLDLSPRTIVRWIREGKIVGVKEGRVWRVWRGDIEKLMRDGTPKS